MTGSVDGGRGQWEGLHTRRTEGGCLPFGTSEVGSRERSTGVGPALTQDKVPSPSRTGDATMDRKRGLWDSFSGRETSGPPTDQGHNLYVSTHKSGLAGRKVGGPYGLLLRSRGCPRRGLRPPRRGPRSSRPPTAVRVEDVLVRWSEVGVPRGTTDVAGDV